MDWNPGQKDFMSSLELSGGDGWRDVPVLGIIGGGQLARMLCMAAGRMGVKTCVLEKFPDSPAEQVASESVVGNWNDGDALKNFCADCDIVTLESEFVEADLLNFAAESGTPIFPAPSTVELVQDKFIQKSRLQECGVEVPDFAGVDSMDALRAFGEASGWPVVLKTRKLGYDGKGNTTVSGPEDVERAWRTLGNGEAPLFCEAFVPFTRELAIMICTSTTGECVHYPVVETVQKDHICHQVTCPASGDSGMLEIAAQTAAKAVNAVQGIGSFGVELFETEDGRILVNELAPRVHNSGHYTIEACQCSQFENHVRAVLGLPLGSPALIHPAAVMVNILGQKNGAGWPEGLIKAFESGDAQVHWYGKMESKSGRKMGHVTAVGDDMDKCLVAAREAADLVYS